MKASLNHSSLHLAAREEVFDLALYQGTFPKTHLVLICYGFKLLGHRCWWLLDLPLQVQTQAISKELCCESRHSPKGKDSMFYSMNCCLLFMGISHRSRIFADLKMIGRLHLHYFLQQQQHQMNLKRSIQFLLVSYSCLCFSSRAIPLSMIKIWCFPFCKCPQPFALMTLAPEPCFQLSSFAQP